MMAPENGYAAAGNLQPLNDISLPIFNVEQVQLQFSIASDFVAAQVANNVLVLALSNGRILRIDLDNPADIDGGCYNQWVFDIADCSRYRFAKEDLRDWCHTAYVP